MADCAFGEKLQLWDSKLVKQMDAVFDPLVPEFARSEDPFAFLVSGSRFVECGSGMVSGLNGAELCKTREMEKFPFLTAKWI